MPAVLVPDWGGANYVLSALIHGLIRAHWHTAWRVGRCCGALAFLLCYSRILSWRADTYSEVAASLPGL